MLLVIVGGFLIFRLSSDEEAPSREFTELEFAGADDDHTGTLLFAQHGARRQSPVFSNAARTWTSPATTPGH